MGNVIDISYIELHTLLMEHVVVDVVEGGAKIFSPQCEPALSPTNLRMILCVSTRIYDFLLRSLFCSLITITYIEIHTPLMRHGSCAIILFVIM